MHQPVQDYGVDHAYPVQKHESYVVVFGDKVQKGVEVIVRESSCRGFEKYDRERGRMCCG
jgi:hypothetical protein